jgi:hypothetical protein
MTTAEIKKTNLAMIYEEIADFILSRPSLEQIANFHLSDASDHYISELLEANRTRGLTPDERAALEDYSRIEHLMQVVKIRAYAKLDEVKRGQG